ncbi:dihydropteroate synthase [Candidatus Riesia pediculicola]|uniref:Dihydropteroate synthase n=1 Tax=Riesia pediculicola (strain USDA) TaxID=515618 RepID=D4G870_RIEPU|nr:dihydropteroate synthase [Candidatus Riesia pediculicola]ADD79714.1 dihydropteroate synthase [Candidatus Riesia pediculicola USDA]ARC53773.1 hypothetical protein AOE55_01240 [Candidatus Riesia pediculicola]QOJ86411.1 dihydropteroate synthase [Candidatus Riesia pediculicola]
MQITCNKYKINLKYPVVMGILNLTPDSFYDVSRCGNIDSALKKVDQMISDGASIIDIGGESTRPNSRKIDQELELERIFPIVRSIIERFDIPISIDSSKNLVIQEMLKIGISMINNVEPFNKKIISLILDHQDIPICVTCNIFLQSNSKNNIISSLNKYFIEETDKLKQEGIKEKRIVIDPGFGFKKNTSENYQILSNLNQLEKLRYPILVGISRKSMIGDLLKIPVQDRLNGSIVCATIACLKGAKIIRAHDVKETAQAVRIVREIIENKRG